MKGLAILRTARRFTARCLSNVGVICSPAGCGFEHVQQEKLASAQECSFRAAAFPGVWRFYVRGDPHRWQAIPCLPWGRIEDREDLEGTQRTRSSSAMCSPSPASWAGRESGLGQGPRQRGSPRPRREDPGLPFQAEEAIQKVARASSGVYPGTHRRHSGGRRNLSRPRRGPRRRIFRSCRESMFSPNFCF